MNDIEVRELYDQVQKIEVRLKHMEDIIMTDEEMSEDSAEEEAEEEAEKPPTPPIDVDAFTKRVARLVMNHAVLLDIKSAIVNRAMNFLFENYDQAHADEMKDLLDVLDLGIEKEELPPERPFAVGAYAGGTGGGGGGAKLDPLGRKPTIGGSEKAGISSLSGTSASRNLIRRGVLAPSTIDKKSDRGLLSRFGNRSKLDSSSVGKSGKIVRSSGNARASIKSTDSAKVKALGEGAGAGGGGDRTVRSSADADSIRTPRSVANVPSLEAAREALEREHAALAREAGASDANLSALMERLAEYQRQRTTYEEGLAAFKDDCDLFVPFLERLLEKGS